MLHHVQNAATNTSLYQEIYVALILKLLARYIKLVLKLWYGSEFPRKKSTDPHQAPHKRVILSIGSEKRVAGLMCWQKKLKPNIKWIADA
ncbi:hypothetical protein KSP39_PZI002348 [Platanthera zijinensis]|uniref:Uncharacterized protein n=1 Tax=Platanthera zijinensis TaxID=2320716 RepID=A0AAP0BY94_9ASPA